MIQPENIYGGDEFTTSGAKTMNQSINPLLIGVRGINGGGDMIEARELPRVGDAALVTTASEGCRIGGVVVRSLRGDQGSTESRLPPIQTDPRIVSNSPAMVLR